MLFNVSSSEGAQLGSCVLYIEKMDRLRYQRFMFKIVLLLCDLTRYRSGAWLAEVSLHSRVTHASSTFGVTAAYQCRCPSFRTRDSSLSILKPVSAYWSVRVTEDIHRFRATRRTKTEQHTSPIMSL